MSNIQLLIECLLTRDFLIDEEKEDPGRDGLMELEKHLRGEYNPAGGNARGAIACMGTHEEKDTWRDFAS